MILALSQSLRSPDPNTQVGACIVDADNVVCGTGYNSWPRGIAVDMLSWTRTGEPGTTKYDFVVHAEANAILNSKANLVGSTVYVTLHPCHECAKLIIQKGIKRVVYLNNPYKDSWQTKTAVKMFDIVDIKVEQLPAGSLQNWLEKLCATAT